METSDFEQIVRQVLDDLPDDFLALMDNVDVVVQRWPTRRQLASVGLKGRYSLMGLYEGTPLTERASDYTLVAPDRITLFQHPIESVCATDAELVSEIRATLWHELAHHFGLSEAEMDIIEERWSAKISSSHSP